MKRKTYLLVPYSFSKQEKKLPQATAENIWKYYCDINFDRTIVITYEYENVSCLNGEYHNSTLILCVEVSGARRVPNSMLYCILSGIFIFMLWSYI